MMMMRVAIFALGLIACGCDSDHSMRAEAKRVLDGWPRPSADFALSMELVRHDGREYVRGRLTNLTNSPVTLDESLLPWNSALELHLEGITRDGKRLPQFPLELGLVGEPHAQTIAAGASVEGEMETRYLNLPLDRKQDVLLAWRYGFGDEKGRGHLLVGTLFVPEDASVRTFKTAE